jgi:hypothetical protein
MFRSLTVALALASLLVSSANARTSFDGNACTVVSAKQVAALGIAGPCKLRKHSVAGFTSSIGIWNLTSRTNHLSIAVNTYSSKSGPYWQVAMKTLNKLPGPARKVKGIGSLAYESGGAGSAISAINFVLGNRVVSINLRTSAAQKSLQSFTAMAKSVAAKL